MNGISSGITNAQCQPYQLIVKQVILRVCNDIHGSLHPTRGSLYPTEHVDSAVLWGVCAATLVWLLVLQVGQI